MNEKADPIKFHSVDTERPESFIQFLDARRDIEDELLVKKLVIDLLDLKSGHHVLDVGCGAGVDTCSIASLVAPRGKATGLDRSAAMIGEARRRVEGSGLPVEFIEGDAQSLPFEDNSFARCRIERVLVHTPDPRLVVREMARVTQPGGLVVASEVELETCFLNSTNEDLARRIPQGIADGVPSGRAARRVQRYFIEAGLQDVRLVPRVVMNKVAFLKLALGGRVQRMVEAGETTADEVEAFWEELDEAEGNGWLCSGIVCLTVAGRKAN
ncbi:methyltransferase domain-containing protein [Pendulispora rubella]|uniref:Methyltransferase domain-containing protein n=1 Tax=Pendulispora rubella TaxID=2741070 RepID=A0ABZ2KR97_9BACT